MSALAPLCTGSKLIGLLREARAARGTVARRGRGTAGLGLGGHEPGRARAEPAAGGTRRWGSRLRSVSSVAGDCACGATGGSLPLAGHRALRVRPGGDSRRVDAADGPCAHVPPGSACRADRRRFSTSWGWRKRVCWIRRRKRPTTPSVASGRLRRFVMRQVRLRRPLLARNSQPWSRTQTGVSRDSSRQCDSVGVPLRRAHLGALSRWTQQVALGLRTPVGMAAVAAGLLTVLAAGRGHPGPDELRHGENRDPRRGSPTSR